MVVSYVIVCLFVCLFVGWLVGWLVCLFVCLFVHFHSHPFFFPVIFTKQITFSKHTDNPLVPGFPWMQLTDGLWMSLLQGGVTWRGTGGWDWIHSPQGCQEYDQEYDRDHSNNYLGGIKCMVNLRDFPLIVHCLGWKYNDPCMTCF